MDEEYKKAKKIVEKYEKNILNSIEDFTCCICKKNQIHKMSELVSLNLNENLWNKGTVEKISPGYGSEFDSQEYYIAICDDCIKNLTENKFIRETSKF